MVRGRSLLLVLTSLVLAGSASAQLTDAEIEARIREGVRQFESGDLAAARTSFESVMAERPDHIVAIYELSYTHQRQGELERALAVLDDAIARDLPVTAEFYSLSASILDDLGRIDEGLRRFEQGIAAFPDHHSLRLNLGITQLRLNDAAGARASFEQAITLQPNHPTAHFYVGQIYAAEGLAAAAILALGKGIGYDSQPVRRSAAAATIKDLMDDSVAITDDGVPIVVMPVDYQIPPMTMGKFTAAVGIHYGTTYALQKKTGADLTYEPYVLAFGMLVSEFARAEFDTASHFAADHYLEFYRSMSENGHEQAFAHLILGSLNSGLAADWVQANGERIAGFQSWARTRPQARQQP